MIASEHRLPLMRFTTGETQLVKMHEMDYDTNKPLDLTGATSTLSLCYFEDKDFKLFKKIGRVKTDGSGLVEFIIDSTDTENLEEGSYLIQRELILADGHVSVIEGEWFLKKGV